jgi:hypothetical protein
MISAPSTRQQLPAQPEEFGDRIKNINPLTGINWVELRKAYSAFIDNPVRASCTLLPQRGGVSGRNGS